MPQSKSFWEHPIAKLEEALSLRKQIAGLQEKLGSLFGSNEEEPAKPRAKPQRRGKRTMSPEARARIAAAQRARWAKTKGTAGAVATSPAKAAPASKGKGGLTPEGRAKLAASMKARWAARRKGAPALNAPSKSAPVAKVKRNISPEARAKMAAAARRRWAKVKK
ncbi:MAG: hypothetical protein QOE70_1655 [Chthoniobacter sp.]|jgi:hypothetical protein|nr:hypothetical protein [Chthoniobacter sp.]